MFSVIGSCVSRDTLSFVAPGAANQYVARSSIASLVSPVSTWARDLELSYDPNVQPWHRAMIEADIRKEHEARRISRMGSDFVLIDLIEERASLLECEPGHYITYGALLQRTNIDFFRGDRRIIRLFTREGLEIWKRALPQFVAMIERYVDQKQLIIHRAFFAGEHSANRWLAEMYWELANSLPNASTIEANTARSRSNPSHKWGAALYHYIDDYYVDVGAKIAATTGEPFVRTPGMTLDRTG